MDDWSDDEVTAVVERSDDEAQVWAEMVSLVKARSQLKREHLADAHHEHE